LDNINTPLPFIIADHNRLISRHDFNIHIEILFHDNLQYVLNSREASQAYFHQKPIVSLALTPWDILTPTAAVNPKLLLVRSSLVFPLYFFIKPIQVKAVIYSNSINAPRPKIMFMLLSNYAFR